MLPDQLPKGGVFLDFAAQIFRKNWMNLYALLARTYFGCRAGVRTCGAPEIIYG
jgi:hypothetical protein